MHLQCILILDNFYNFSKNLGFCVSQIQVTCRRIDLLYLGYWEIYNYLSLVLIINKKDIKKGMNIVKETI